jgi:hypothetical protein
MAKSKPGGGVRRRALFTSTGRRRSTSSLINRLATATPGSAEATAIEGHLRRRLSVENRAARVTEARNEAVRNIPGAEFMSPAQLRAAVGAGGVVRRPGEDRARRTRAARARLTGAERSRENRRLSDIRETMRSRF